MSTKTGSGSFDGENARVDTATAALIERGVEFYKTLGKTVAIAYFKENHVPAAIIERVLGPSQSRRPSKPAPPGFY